MSNCCDDPDFELTHGDTSPALTGQAEDSDGNAINLQGWTVTLILKNLKTGTTASLSATGNSSGVVSKSFAAADWLQVPAGDYRFHFRGVNGTARLTIPSDDPRLLRVHPALA